MNKNAFLTQIIFFLICAASHANALNVDLPWKFINDYLGNPVVVVNQNQNIQYQTYQDPWGNLEMSVGVPTSNPEFKFTDKEQDEDSDLYYFQARYYGDGRFLTRDSVELEDALTDIYQLNPYQFNRNNPVKYKDDDGKIGWDATIDVLSFSMSLKDFKDNPDLTNTASLAWDSVALLPVIPGGAGILKRGIKEVYQGVKNLKHTEETVKEGTKVFRVWGNAAKKYGKSWTTVNPEQAKNFRDAAGLPKQNTGKYLTEGILKNSKGVKLKPADPLHGNKGGLPELVIQNPKRQIV